MAFLLILALVGLAVSTSTFSPIKPPSIPLAVRSPYLSTWLAAGNGPGSTGNLPGRYPNFWNGAITGWTGFVRVDGSTYTWMGAPDNGLLAEQVAFNYTSTRSIFMLKAANLIQMRVTFLSPVTPEDMQRSSLPFSYMDVEVSSLDGNSHKVELYTDISAEWVSGNRENIAQWEYGVTRDSAPPTYSSPSSPSPTYSAPLYSSSQSSTPTSPSATYPHRHRRHPKAEAPDDMARAVTKHNPPQTYQTYGTETEYYGWRTAVTHSDPVVKGSPASLPTAASFSAVHPLNAPAVASPGPANPQPGGVAYHKVYRQTQQLLSEFNDQAEWGYWYYATSNVETLSHQSGSDEDVRQQFQSNGYLDNTQDNEFRAIEDRFPVFAFAVDLDSVDSTPKSVLFSINLNQRDVIQFQGTNNATQVLPGLWTQYFADDLSSLRFFYNDYQTVSGITAGIDSKVASDSFAAVGPEYLILTSLAFRQAFATLQLAIQADTGNPLLFLKEISSDGNVNTVDIIFPAMPLLLYANPGLLKLVLDPLFINQEAGNWPFKYPIHDIGSHYPNATGHSNGTAEQQPLEEGGNMIIMTLAYAQRTGDVGYLQQHYDILRQWNEYLVEEALIPGNQISTDDFAGPLPNQTNLALKGMIGIEAMSGIANLTGNYEDASNYSSIAHDYIAQWQQLGIDQDAPFPHTELNYTNITSFGLLYNLYSDRLLNTNLVPESVYTMQSNFYPTVAGTYGVRLDTRGTVTKSDWQLWAASIASQSTRDLFINKIVEWIGATPSNYSLTDLYDTEDLQYDSIRFIARPAIGGLFSILGLET